MPAPWSFDTLELLCFFLWDIIWSDATSAVQRWDEIFPDWYAKETMVHGNGRFFGDMNPFFESNVTNCGGVSAV